jgi:acetylornithine deacetylase/succinyl-diaminopimelate desuccinylase-like protein
VGEEGLGDLRGVRHLFAHHPLRERFRGFLTVDSPEVDRIVTGGIGSRRFRITFRGPGGHSLRRLRPGQPDLRHGGCRPSPRRHRRPARAGDDALRQRRRRRHLDQRHPETAVMEVDLRSASAEILDALAAEFLDGVRAAAKAETCDA